MYNFENIEKFIVQQKKELGEVFTGIETKNKYRVYDEDGKELFFAFEEKSNWFVRQSLRSARPFTILITNEINETVYEIKRPYRWFFHEASIYDSNQNHIATMKMEFALFQKKYNVFSPDESLLFKLFGPFFKPWTFKIIEDGNEVGKITKKWSGTLKEMFTTADNFGAEFPLEWSNEKKAAALGAVFLIDFVHFEAKN